MNEISPCRLAVVMLLKNFNDVSETLNLYPAEKPVGAFSCLPVLNMDEWRRKADNCYSFALNLHLGRGFRPGELSGCIAPSPLGGFEDYIRGINEGALSDGLRNIESLFTDLKENEYPAALFFKHKDDCPYGEYRKHDFHWFAMCSYEGKTVWAHKQGEKPVRLVKGSMFDYASNRNYNFFGGYYAVSDQLFFTLPHNNSSVVTSINTSMI